MKRWISVFLVLSLAFVILSVPALAAAPEEGITDVKVESAYASTVSIKVDSGKEKLDITYTGAQSGCYYLVLAMSDQTGTPTDNNIVYIDQASAGGSSITMTVYPSQLQAQTYYIYMSSNASSGITKLVKVASFTYEVPYKLGDVNEDKKISGVDALWVLQSVAGNRSLTESQKMAADADRNNKLSGVDALYILQAVAGNRTLA
ncbi:MAG: dockerin type I repeat-containing protein [Oscillospiraceae bacterium]|nr:dockerin type I repeat-containing protein [Oscillospiraceae bacterium]